MSSEKSNGVLLKDAKEWIECKEQLLTWKEQENEYVKELFIEHQKYLQELTVNNISSFDLKLKSYTNELHESKKRLVLIDEFLNIANNKPDITLEKYSNFFVSILIDDKEKKGGVIPPNFSFQYKTRFKTYRNYDFVYLSFLALQESNPEFKGFFDKYDRNQTMTES